MKKIKLGICGSDQYLHQIPIFEKYGYEVTDIQCIYSMREPWDVKIDKIRDVINWCDVVYNIYTGADFWALASYAKEKKKAVATHWIGTDALDAIEGRVGYLGWNRIDIHFSCFQHIRDELRMIGIESKILPVVPFNMSLELEAMPDNHAILVYLPEDRLEHYGYPEACQVIEHFDKLQFHVVGNGNRELFDKYDNVEVHGVLSNEEMDDLWKKITVLLRYVKHDGLSMMVIEALTKGRRAIWNFPYEGVDYVTSLEEVFEKIQNIVSLPPHAESKIADMVRRELSDSNYMKIFNQAMHDIGFDFA